MDNKEIINNIDEEKTFPTDGGSRSAQPGGTEDWYIDLTAEEAAAYALLMAKVRGPLRTRKVTIITAALCSVIMLGLAFGEWWSGMVDRFDYITAACAVLIWAPVLYLCLILPHSIRRNARKQHERNAAAGIVYAGRLTVTDEYVEKVTPSATAHVRLDQRAFFVETADMMVLASADSLALVLPARCMTDEMAAAVRRAADRLPVRNRRFIARIRPQGQSVAPVAAVKPERLWTATFTYTHEEYVTVVRGNILHRFWQIAPRMTPIAFIGALVFGWSGKSLTPCIGYFLVFMGLLLLLQLVLPLLQVKRRVSMLTAHDLTVKVTFDTVAMRMQYPRGSEIPILWCDIKHVYDRDPFAEIVGPKNANLLIPKRAIEDIPAFEAALAQCRGKK